MNFILVGLDLAVERTMALENQAVGDVEQLVKEETKRRQKQ